MVQISNHLTIESDAMRMVIDFGADKWFEHRFPCVAYELWTKCRTTRHA